MIASHYLRLEALTGSPVVTLNRAVAVAESEGAQAGLAILSGLDQALPHNHRLPAVRAELARRAGNIDWLEPRMIRRLAVAPTMSSERI